MSPGSTKPPRPGSDPGTQLAWRLLADVQDPELPGVGIVELGIVRAVEVTAGGAQSAGGERTPAVPAPIQVRVRLTPTWIGCPALELISDEVRRVLATRFNDVEVAWDWDPPWRSDDISARGRAQLAAAGISPPQRVARQPAGRQLAVLPTGSRPRRCPRCGADDLELLSEFGGTPCLAAWRCRACAEPFGHVKSL